MNAIQNKLEKKKQNETEASHLKKLSVIEFDR